MIVGLLAAGAALCVCGLFALGYGLSYKEFSVGSTMIQAGVTLLGSGIVVVALAMVASELQKLSDTLQGKRPAGASRGRQLNIPEGLFPEPPADASAGGDARAASNMSADAVLSAGSHALPPIRKPFVPEPIPEPRSFDSAWPGPSTSPPPAPAAPAPINPMLQPASPAASPVTSPVTSPATGPGPDARPRRSDLFRRSARASSLSGNPPAEGDAAARAPAKSEIAKSEPADNEPADNEPAKAEPSEPLAASAEEPAAPASDDVTVLKAGVVDGMAYTLYSDGSIEAELADGKVRFASIEALRAHLDQRGS